MVKHAFTTNRQGGVCVAVTDGEACGLTHEQHEQIQKEADCRARRLLGEVRRWGRGELPPSATYDSVRQQLEGALWEGLNAGRTWVTAASRGQDGEPSAGETSPLEVATASRL